MTPPSKTDENLISPCKTDKNKISPGKTDKKFPSSNKIQVGDENIIIYSYKNSLASFFSIYSQFALWLAKPNSDGDML